MAGIASSFLLAMTMFFAFTINSCHNDNPEFSQHFSPLKDNMIAGSHFVFWEKYDNVTVQNG